MVNSRMNPATEVTREALIAELRRVGARVTPAKLHRWTDAGLLPRPTRRGLGRGKGKGTVSVYPATALSQAFAIHSALQLSRSLDDAAWTVWLRGFPVTAYVRTLLADECAVQDRRLRQALTAMRKPEVRKRVAQALRRDPSGIESLFRVRPPSASDAFVEIVRMLLEVQIGDLRAPAYDDAAWDDLHEFALTEAGDPSNIAKQIEDFRRSTALRSQQVSFRAIRMRLKRSTDEELCACRNEITALHVITAAQVGTTPGVVTRSAFLRYFAQRLLDVERAPSVRALLKAYGIEPAPLATADEALARGDSP